MEITLTTTAQTQLNLITEVASNGTGFLMGQDMGRFRIIESLLPVDFSEATIDDIYSKMVQKAGNKLLGVFFHNIEPIQNEWLWEDIILEITNNEPLFYKYVPEKGPVRVNISEET